MLKPSTLQKLLLVVLLGLGGLSTQADEALPPERIVSLLPSLTEMIFAVGAGDQVVGVTNLCTYPPEAASRTKVGGYVPSSMSLERVVSLRPDLVIASGDIQQPVVEELRRLGVRVETVLARDVAGVIDGVRRVGVLVGHEQDANALASRLRREIDELRQRFAGIADEGKPRVFYEVWHEPLMTAGQRSFISELIELAGGRSLFHEVDREYFQVSFEEVVRRRPEVILGAEIEGAMGNLASLAELPGWRELPAVRDGRVFAVDGDIVSRPGPRVTEALRLIARRLHPEFTLVPELTP